MKQFKLPDVGEGLTEAEIVSWKVKPGDTVKVNEIIVEIETAKSLVELPSPVRRRRHRAARARGHDGRRRHADHHRRRRLAVPPRLRPRRRATTWRRPIPDATAIGTPGEDEAVEPGLIGGPAPGGRTSVLVGYGPKTTTAARRPRKGADPRGARRRPPRSRPCRPR